MSGQHDALAVLETGSNQAYIFATNRMRDHIGASFLIDEVRRVAAEKATGTEVLTSSGHVEYRFETENDGREWVTAVTTWAAQHAPALDLCGSVVPMADSLDDTRRAAFGELARVRGLRPAPLFRQRILPWLRTCDDSGGVATDRKNPIRPLHDAGQRISVDVLSKRSAYEDAVKRIEDKLRAHKFDEKLIKNIDDALVRDKESEPLSSEENWRCIIHADGNAMGRIFLNFGAIARKMKLKEEEYLVYLRALSESIEKATWTALKNALDDFLEACDAARVPPVPVYPLVVAGDDLTMITDGRWGLFLAERYLWHFEDQTRRKLLSPEARKIVKIAPKVLGTTPDNRLRACAGVAIFKHHFPVWRGYQLAEQLCQSAKTTVGAASASALDWHVVYDSTPPDLSELRANLEAGNTLLTLRPYGVGEKPQGKTEGQLPALSALVHGVAELGKTDQNGKRRLPQAATHTLREAFYRGPASANRSRDMLLPQHRAAFDEFLQQLHDGGGLFDAAPEGATDRVLRTGVIDAVDGQGFCAGLLTPVGSDS